MRPALESLEARILLTHPCFAAFVDQEPNDTLKQANAVLLDNCDRIHGPVQTAWIEGHIQTTADHDEDIDLFTFSTDSERRITLTFDGDAAQAGVLPQLLDASGTVLATAAGQDTSGDGTPDSATLSYFTESSGEFFVQVGPSPIATSLEFYPSVNISTGDVYIANFGASPFQDQPPTGFNPGWYETRHGEQTIAEWNPDDRQANIILSHNNLTAETAFPTTGTNNFEPYGAGDLIGVAVDLENNRAYFSKNGVWQGDADPNLLSGGLEMGMTPGSPEFFPTINISTGDVYSANFGASPFRHQPPAGFSAGWYETQNDEQLFAEWNPADRQANIILSNNNLTAETVFPPNYSDPHSDNDSVRATIGKTSGSWYFEILVAARSYSGYNSIGTATRALSLEVSPGDSDNGCGYRAGGYAQCKLASITTPFPPGNLDPHSDNDSVRATIGKTSGRWYFEILVAARSTSGYNAIGTATKALWLEVTPGADDNGCGYQASGYVQCKLRAITTSFESYGAGDVIGVAVDLDDNRAYFSKNGVWQGGADPNTLSSGLEMGMTPGFPDQAHLPYTLGVEVAPDPHHEHEPNDELDQANPIELRIQHECAEGSETNSCDSSPELVIDDCEQSGVHYIVPANPSTTDLLLFGIYESRGDHSGNDYHPTGEAQVLVDRTTPVVLVLGSFEPTHWTVVASPGSQIERVILIGGRFDQTTTVPDGVPVESHTAAGIYGYGDDAGGGKTRELIHYAEALSGRSLTAFAGCYHATQFRILDKPGLGPGYLPRINRNLRGSIEGDLEFVNPPPGSDSWSFPNQYSQFVTGQDFFSFEVPAGRTLQIELMGPLTGVGLDGQITLFNGRSSKLISDADSTDGLSLDWTAQEGGTFYVLVDRANDFLLVPFCEVGPSCPPSPTDLTQYTLQVTAKRIPNPVEDPNEHEPNDSFETANRVELGLETAPRGIIGGELEIARYGSGPSSCSDPDEHGEITCTDDIIPYTYFGVDFFAFDMPPAHEIHLELTGGLAKSGGLIALFDSHRRGLVTDADPSDGISLDWSAPDGGLFFVEVFGLPEGPACSLVGVYTSAGSQELRSVCRPNVALPPDETTTTYTLLVEARETTNSLEGADEHESNDTIEQANRLYLLPAGVFCFPFDCPAVPLPAEGQRERVAKGIAGGSTHDVDFFSFYVSPGEQVSVGLGCVPGFEFEPQPIFTELDPGPQPVLFVTVFDEVGNEIGRTGVDGVESILFKSERGGVYFARVELQSGAPDAEVANYELHLHARKFSHEGQDESEPNNTIDEADPIELLSLPTFAPGIELRGGDASGIAGGPTHDQDVFSFEVQADEHVTVDVQGLMFDYGTGVARPLMNRLAANRLHHFDDELERDTPDRGMPLVDEATGESIDRITRILRTHPDLSFGAVDVVVFDANGNEVGRSSSTDAGAVSFDAAEDGNYYAVVSVAPDVAGDRPVHYRLGVLARSDFDPDLLTDPVYPESGNAEPEVIVLGAGRPFRYTDSSGDQVQIVFRGRGGHATITFTGSTADGSDIASVEIAGARRSGSLSIQSSGDAEVGSIEIHAAAVPGARRRGGSSNSGFGTIRVDGNVGMVSSDVNVRSLAIDGVLGEIYAPSRQIADLRAGTFDAALGSVGSILSLRVEDDVTDMMFSRYLPFDEPPA